VSDLGSKFEKGREPLQRHIFAARFILAIVICPLIGLGLFVSALSEKGLARLTFRDIYPAISITLAGGVYLFLYRYLTGPITSDDNSPDGNPQDTSGEQESRTGNRPSPPSTPS
jgi:hypothetical protein